MLQFGRSALSTVVVVKLDLDKRNAFDIEKHISTQLKPKPDEVYEVFDIDLSGEPATA